MDESIVMFVFAAFIWSLVFLLTRRDSKSDSDKDSESYIKGFRDAMKQQKNDKKSD